MKTDCFVLRLPEVGEPLKLKQARPAHANAPSVESGLILRRWNQQDHQQLLKVWKELDQRIGQGSIASSFVWTDSWLHHYGDLVPHFFVTLEAQGQMKGIVLITRGVGQKQGPFSLKTCHIGTAGEPEGHSVCVEYNRLLVEPGFHEQFVSGIVELLKRDRSWEEVRFDGFTSESLVDWRRGTGDKGTGDRGQGGRINSAYFFSCP